MKRRYFLQVAAAAALSPLTPHRAAAVPCDTSANAGAVQAATQWAYVSPDTQKHVLRLDEATSVDLVARLKGAGILGEEGATLSSRMVSAHQSAVAKALDGAAKACAREFRRTI